MIRITPLAQASLGQVLGEAASADGHVLLAADTTLTQAHLDMLAARGVQTLTIRIAAEQRAPIDTKVVLATDRILRPRFVRTDLQHPAMKELYRLALMRQLQLIARGGNKSSSGRDGSHAG